MWESRVLQRAFERLELHEGKLSRAVLRGGGGGDVTSLPDTWVGNHPGLPGPSTANRSDPEDPVEKILNRSDPEDPADPADPAHNLIPAPPGSDASEASSQIASVSSDRSTQIDSQFEASGAGTVGPEDPRQFGSNPVVPT